MKFVKSISLFLIYPVVMLGIGFFSGIMFVNYFYPGQAKQQQQQYELIDNPETITQDWQNAVIDKIKEEETPLYKESVVADNSEKESEDLLNVIAVSEKLNADTKYVLEETDMYNKSVVEIVSKVPAKYLGMDREQFLEAMGEYETFPPLSELERGFVDLEVLSFSSEKVVIQMNYEYTQPSESFYLMVENNYIVVYLDDKETVYMYTDILLTELPDRIQQDVINVMFVPDEENLYDFLETYSS